MQNWQISSQAILFKSKFWPYSLQNVCRHITETDEFDKAGNVLLVTLSFRGMEVSFPQVQNRHAQVNKWLK